MYIDDLFIEFAANILHLIDKDQMNNLHALERVKLYYAKVEPEELQNLALDFLDEHNIHYSVSFSNKGKEHSVTIRHNNFQKVFNDLDLTYALIEATIYAYNKFVLLKEQNDVNIVNYKVI